MRKSERARIRQKFGGRCAYCGCELPEKWHVEHVVPKAHDHYVNHFEIGKEWLPEDIRDIDKIKSINDETNLLPVCVSCNVLKRSLSLEQFRKYLNAADEVLTKYQAIYKAAKRYGLVTVHNDPVRFYF